MSGKVEKPLATETWYRVTAWPNWEAVQVTRHNETSVWTLKNGNESRHPKLGGYNKYFPSKEAAQGYLNQLLESARESFRREEQRIKSAYGQIEHHQPTQERTNPK